MLSFARTDHAMELHAAALHTLLETDPATKAQVVTALSAACKAGSVRLDTGKALAAPASIPGRPIRPDLVPPLQVGRRSMATP
jgi:uncharacterized ferritin-like protein (DUF455 family)